jgi:hypothetical protein
MTDLYVAHDRRIDRLQRWNALFAVLAALTIWTLVWAGSALALAVMAAVVIGYLGFTFYVDAERRRPVEALG